MENNPISPAGWKSSHAYGLAVICLVLGTALGFLLRGSAAENRPSESLSSPAGTPPAASDVSSQNQVTPEQLRHMVDKTVQPLLAELSKTPNDAKLLAKIGDVYSDARQFPDAIQYYDRSLKVNPRNTDIRTDLATAQFYSGHTDAAIAEFNRALQYNPNHAGALFNLGVVKWQGKNDPAGAIAAWERLLKTNPDAVMKQRVEGLISKAKEHLNN